jgi:hypothetical protein
VATRRLGRHDAAWMTVAATILAIVLALAMLYGR